MSTGQADIGPNRHIGIASCTADVTGRSGYTRLLALQIERVIVAGNIFSMCFHPKTTGSGPSTGLRLKTAARGFRMSMTI